MDNFFQNLEVYYFHIILVIIIFSLGYSFMWSLYGEKKYTAFLPMSFSPCLRPIFYANVNVYMYFEAVLFLVGSLNHLS